MLACHGKSNFPFEKPTKPFNGSCLGCAKPLLLAPSALPTFDPQKFGSLHSLRMTGGHRLLYYLQETPNKKPTRTPQKTSTNPKNSTDAGSCFPRGNETRKLIAESGKFLKGSLREGAVAKRLRESACTLKMSCFDRCAGSFHHCVVPLPLGGRLWGSSLRQQLGCPFVRTNL